MEIKGTHSFAAAPQAVWDALHNSQVLKNSVPGVESLTWQGENAINATISGIGPLKGPYSGTVNVTEHTAPSHMKIERNGGQASGSLIVDLAPNGSGTMLSYVANATLSGALSMLDNPLTRPLIDNQIGQFFSKLDSQL